MRHEPKAVIFDLDDTLYPLRRFVHSGFAAVAEHLEQTWRTDRRETLSVLARASRTSPGRELQACLAHFGLSLELVPALVEVIRSHTPALRLPAASRAALEALRRDWYLGIVTNGLPDLQARKVDALGLRSMVDCVVYAHEWGDGRGKPDQAPFCAAADRLGVSRTRAVFVGDDARCDVFGAGQVGMRTVQVTRHGAGRWAASFADATTRTLADVPAIANGWFPMFAGVHMWREARESIEIGTRRVGAGAPLFVIAEIGLNHGGSVDRALRMVDAAADAGASAVKLQTIFADGLVSAGAPAPAHVAAQSMREFFASFELDEAAHHAIAARVRARGLALMATPFSLAAVDLLERVGIDAYKIASGDLTWDVLIRRCAETRKPVVLSSGMSSLSEAGRATACARLGGATAVALLHCVSSYPVPRGSENLRAIATLGEAFRLPVGLSDHGDDGFAVPLAVAMGASLYERHLVLAKDDGSIDGAVSSTPEELDALVAVAARSAAALGTEKMCLPAEAVNLRGSRRGLYAARSLKAGEVVGVADVIALRPAIGLDVFRAHQLVGAALERDVEAGMPFLERDLLVRVSRVA